MANRQMNGSVRSFRKERVFVDLKATIGASGAATISATDSLGIASITRDGSVAGKYTVQFGYTGSTGVVTETYKKLLALSWCFNVAGASGPPASSTIERIAVLSDTIASDGKLVLQCTGPTAGGNTAQVATDPANGEIMHMVFQVANSDAI